MEYVWSMYGVSSEEKRSFLHGISSVLVVKNQEWKQNPTPPRISRGIIDGGVGNSILVVHKLL